MDFFIDIIKMTIAIIISVAFIVIILRFLTNMTEPFFEKIWSKFKK